MDKCLYFLNLLLEMLLYLKESSVLLVSSGLVMATLSFLFFFVSLGAFDFLSLFSTNVYFYKLEKFTVCGFYSLAF